MAVTPEVQSVLDVIAEFGGPAREDQTPAQVRQSFATLNSLGIATKVDMASVSDRVIPGPAGYLPVRVYAATDEPGPPPVLLYVPRRRRRLPGGGALAGRSGQRHGARDRPWPVGRGWRFGRWQPGGRRGAAAARRRAGGALPTARLPGHRRSPVAPVDRPECRRLPAHQGRHGVVPEPLRGRPRLDGPPGLAAAGDRRGRVRPGPRARDHGGVRPAARRGRGVRRTPASSGRRGDGNALRRHDPRVLLDGRPDPGGQGRRRRGRRGTPDGARLTGHQARGTTSPPGAGAAASGAATTPPTRRAARTAARSRPPPGRCV